MISCHDVAQYFLKREDRDAGDLISNLKLQKLVYYAQGFYFALYDERGVQLSTKTQRLLAIRLKKLFSELPKFLR